MGSYDIEDDALLFAHEPVAIVGSSCRFPGGATSPSKLWELLEAPRDVLQEIPTSRFSTKAFHNPDSQHHGSMNVQHAYLLEEDPRAFDRDFFSINPKEAEAMDPQQRMLLETVYEGVESSGYSMQQLRGSSTAVFVGCMSYDYHFTAIRGIDSLPQYHATGTAASILSNRVSYFYDWRGPSVTIDTACSSSLVAVHQAVSALRNGEAKMAVAAGSNLILGPEPFVSESKLNMLSPNGRSYMWDADADGYTRGEGFAAVFLKTLSQAIADGDHIDAIIRETGVNSDGKTMGITMPSSESQARLIQETYARCGLDPARESDRPQYFEAHGTGTPAGDPIEARAIHDVFFPAGGDDGQLMVGSIKTVIGHTEGTAGVAGVLKASLAVQHGQIPANLHFNNLNSKIEPFSKKLRVPTETATWPHVAQGLPRRVSVNSFGFGGTNAHAIIESFDFERDVPAPNHASRLCGPFVLSGNSSPALAGNAGALAGYLRANPDVNLDRLVYTLFDKADLPVRAAFSVKTAEELADKLEASQDSLQNKSRSTTLPNGLPPRILGVFTGQGAQWATMGQELYSTSDVFRRAMHQLQESLESLPPKDRPDWNIVDELKQPAETSRIGKAVFSQPLCTAIQVGLTDMLHEAGIEFSAVVGHSSGEIGAAYAAGYLKASDAIRIAYYKGMHSHLAQGPEGKRGKMMAVGMSMEEAEDFCSDFDGAITVAASNSQTSCTLAGDTDAIDDALESLEAQGTFARKLQVDTAYHSHHMKACGGPYLASMEECGIAVQLGREGCHWHSSVWGLQHGQDDKHSFESAEGQRQLQGPYWVDNMTGAVLFDQALTMALQNEEPFDAVVEVGPHPALKGPSTETIKAQTENSTLPYTGVLKRGQHAGESFAEGLGLLWESFPSARPLVTFDSVSRAFISAATSNKPYHKSSLKALRGLPTYQWDHTGGLVWKESRTSRAFRTQQSSRHELLGHAVTHGERDRREVHWKQVLRLNELPWLAGHKIQGEVLFPAAGYLSMTYEAAIRLVDEQQPLRLVELHDIDIVRAMRLQEESAGLEVVFSIRITSQSDDCITATVACYSGAVDSPQPLDAPLAALTAHFTGGVKLWLGDPRKDALPLPSTPPLPMDPLDMDRLYSSLSKVGFNYADHFQAKSMLRRLGRTQVTVASPPESSSLRPCMHPTLVDTAFQGVLAAFAFPEDGRLGTIYLPTKVDCVRISMAASESDLTADVALTSTAQTSLTGDVDLFSADDAHTEVQIRGVHLSAVGPRNDPWLYAGVTWARDINSGLQLGTSASLSEEEGVLYERLLRTAYFYMRQLRKKILPQETLLMGEHRKHMMKWVTEHLLPQIEAGEHLDIRPEWKDDTREMVDEWRASYSSDNNDMNILHAMGKNLVNVARGTTPPLRVLTEGNMLDRLYVEGIGVQHGNVDLGNAVKQLADQYPQMRIIEVGAGTGGTTRTVLDAVQNQFASYTYTDISTGFFENPRAMFSEHANKMAFKTLNIENDPAEQGYEAGTFDMVVSSNCLHATKNLGETLSNCRKLLRPGGRLVLLEVTRDFLPTQLVMATLPGWFLGVDDGRVWAPTVSVERWDELLKANGFSGVDFSSSPSYCSVIIAQAVDETVQSLRQPLASPPATVQSLQDILIVGAGTTSTLVKQTQEALQAAIPGDNTNITLLSGLEDIEVPAGATVLCLADLDTPVFCGMNEKRFTGLQAVMGTAEVVLWVTSGAKSGKNPDANLTPGLSSALLGERMDIRLQFLDVDDPSSLEPSMLAETLLRLVFFNPAKAGGLLWNQEPELALKEGVLYIPRIRSLDTINHRSAARVREVTQRASLRSTDTVVTLDQDEGTMGVSSVLAGHTEEDEILVQVIASSHGTLTCDESSSVYVCIGQDVASGDKVLALSGTQSSLAKVSADQVLHRFQQKETDVGDAALLNHILARALAERLLSNSNGSTWIHGVPDGLSTAIDAVARERRITVLQTTSDMERNSNIKLIHPFASAAHLQGLCPEGLQSFINMSHAQHEVLSALIATSAPNSSVVIKQAEEITADWSLSDLRSLAKKSLGDYKQPSAEDIAEVVPVDEVSTVVSKRLGPAAVIDWKSTETVDALVRPLDHFGLFAPNKTYLLCGMTGDLGISVCLWMVSNGARNVVLTSRSPNVPANVLDTFSRMGATVRPVAADITNMDSLRGAYKEIKSSMPPIGGVMNAAMVLRDQLFHTLPWDDFAAVLAPKVTGSKNLDELFGDEQLDFFICFSSTTSIVGSIGQSAYAAANHYMASLVQGRKQRGLAGSVVYISILTGFGYIFRRDVEHADTIYKAIVPRCERQSETDLHEMLAEAIVCGRPGTDQVAELITGIRPVFQEEWREDPRLSCYIGQQQTQNDSSNDQSGESASVKDQLAQAEEPGDCSGILLKCFTTSMGNLLELDPEQLDTNLPVTSLGIDSLVAIRIREWFLRELGVDVPVLKVMSDTYSMSQLCEDVLGEWQSLQG